MFKKIVFPILIRSNCFINPPTNVFQQISTGLAKIHTTNTSLAGHSKWANIRHIKALKDGQKSLAMAKYARQIRLAIQDGGSPNPAINSQLRQSIDEALKQNMTQSTIQGILKKAATTSTTKLKRYTVEARYLNKIFMVLVIYTENFTRDRMTISTLFRKGGATAMDIKHIFKETGFIEATIDDKMFATLSPGSGGNSDSAQLLEEICTEHAIQVGAEEIEIIDSDTRKVMFICEPLELDRIRQNLFTIGYCVESVEHAYIPNIFTSLTDAEYSAYATFKDKLKAIDGLEDIYDNLEEVEE